ncbi:MAG TPA: efflux RND transporter periplasmic adaptor subunit [Anaerolineaceae bacterium]|nr:efflux RND transporter periplasmic adaptor subunit [Anaerolineaceae bacterium]
MKHELLAQMRVKPRTMLLILTLIFLVGAAGYAVLQENRRAAAQGAAAASGAYQTTAVRPGDLTLSISGSGTVLSTRSVELSFPVAGTVAALTVQVGDTVTQGQVLATLGEIDVLELDVQNQELAVQTAQKNLAELRSNGEINLAQALADRSAAEAAYAQAQANLHRPGDGRCLPEKTKEYYFEYFYAQLRVDEWEKELNDPDTAYGLQYIQEHLNPLRKERDLAYANLTYCEGYTEPEIRASEAALQLARARLDQASAAYETLLVSSGVDPDAVAIAEAVLENAQSQLAKAVRTLAGATLIAPMDGTVMAVSAGEGETVGTETFIELADLERPAVQVYVDETDLAKIAVGCAAEVSFESLPGQSFTGVVSEVSPTLVNVQSVAMVQGLVALESGKTASGRPLPPGLSALVEITCHHAQGALRFAKQIAPAQAIYATDAGAAYVYVLNAAGQPEKRAVEVGSIC